MGSVNKVILIGRLGKDPEIRTTQYGRIANFTLATSERWKRDGVQNEKTEWHKIVVYADGLISIAEQYLRKGSEVYIEGCLETREWEDREGGKRQTTSVVLKKFNSTLTMLGKAPSKDADNRGDSGAGGVGRAAADDEEVPF